MRDLAARILSDHTTPERLQEVEAGQDRFDRRLWDELARSNLLALALPPDVGGSGYGLFETGLLLEQQGRTVAPVPLLPTLVLGALPVANFGTDEQRRRLLTGVAEGRTVLCGALAVPGTGPGGPASVPVQAVAAGDGWRLHGSVSFVPAAHLAERIVVPAQTGVGRGVFLLDPRAAGCSRTRLTITGGEPQFRLDLDGVPVADRDVLTAPPDGDAVVAWMAVRATAALCALQVGVADQAVRMTAAYTNGREQFGHPLSRFQAVQQRLADAYIDVECMRVTAWQATWRLDRGLPAEAEVAMAKFWAAEAGQRVAATAQHLHGGVGVDLAYPLHRYFLWAKQIELTLGPATAHLARLGADLAAGRLSATPD